MNGRQFLSSMKVDLRLLLCAANLRLFASFGSAQSRFFAALFLFLLLALLLE